MSQKVLVAGTGISGISAAKLLLAQGGEVILYDGNEKLSEEKLKAKFDEGAKVTIVLGELKKTDLAGVLMNKGTNCDLSGSSRHWKCPKCTGTGFMFPRGMSYSQWKINEIGGGIVSRLLRYRGDITRFTC